jgi:hypothetical protein
LPTLNAWLTFPLAVGNSGGKIGQVDRRDKVIIINSQLKVWPSYFDKPQ